MNFFNQPSDVAPVVQLYAQLTEKSARLLQMAQQERWDEFPDAESELNRLIGQIELLRPAVGAGLSEADALLEAVYIQQIMSDNEKTAILVRERTSRLEGMLKASARRQRLEDGYGTAREGPFTGPQAEG